MDGGETLGKEALYGHRSSARGPHTEIEGGKGDQVTLFNMREAWQEMDLHTFCCTNKLKIGSLSFRGLPI
jgi:hypothetical protein